MSFDKILLIALALSVDSFAVAVSNAVSIKGLTSSERFATSASLALFQGLMPILGFYAGVEFRNYIESVDHWVAFALLAFLGTRMIIMAWNNDSEFSQTRFRKRRLLTQSIATSIDALAVGIAIAVSGYDIFEPALVIGIVTFIVSWIGLKIGKLADKFPMQWCETVGGGVLIFIGTKILIEHLYLN